MRRLILCMAAVLTASILQALMTELPAILASSGFLRIRY